MKKMIIALTLLSSTSAFAENLNATFCKEGVSERLNLVIKGDKAQYSGDGSTWVELKVLKQRVTPVSEIRSELKRAKIDLGEDVAKGVSYLLAVKGQEQVLGIITGVSGEKYLIGVGYMGQLEYTASTKFCK